MKETKNKNQMIGLLGLELRKKVTDRFVYNKDNNEKA